MSTVKHCVRALRRTLRDRRAGTAIEYGLIAALVVVAMMAALSNLANTTVGMWTKVNTKVTAASGN